MTDYDLSKYKKKGPDAFFSSRSNSNDAFFSQNRGQKDAFFLAAEQRQSNLPPRQIGVPRTQYVRVVKGKGKKKTTTYRPIPQKGFFSGLMEQREKAMARPKSIKSIEEARKEAELNKTFRENYRVDSQGNIQYRQKPGPGPIAKLQSALRERARRKQEKESIYNED